MSTLRPEGDLELTGQIGPEMIELGVLNEEAASNGLTRKHILRGRVPKPRGGDGLLSGTTSLVLDPTLMAEP